MVYQLLANYTNVDKHWEVGTLAEGELMDEDGRPGLARIKLFSPGTRHIYVTPWEVCEMGDNMAKAQAVLLDERQNHCEVVENAQFVIIEHFMGTIFWGTIVNDNDWEYNPKQLNDYNVYVAKFSIECAKEAKIPIAFYDGHDGIVKVVIGDIEVFSFKYSGEQKELVSFVRERMKEECLL